MLFSWFETRPRRVFAAICAACLALLAFGLYLQHGVGLEPCPMCIVQRYALVVIAVLAGLAAATNKKIPQLSAATLVKRWRLRSGLES